MKFSKKMLWVGLVLGCIPPIGMWVLNIPKGQWIMINPLGLVLTLLSRWVAFYEDYEIVPRRKQKNE